MCEKFSFLGYRAEVNVYNGRNHFVYVKEESLNFEVELHKYDFVGTNI